MIVCGGRLRRHRVALIRACAVNVCVERGMLFRRATAVRLLLSACLFLRPALHAYSIERRDGARAMLTGRAVYVDRLFRVLDDREDFVDRLVVRGDAAVHRELVIRNAVSLTGFRLALTRLIAQVN